MNLCLQPDEVEEFVTGKLCEETYEATSIHVETCVDCQNLLETFSHTDSNERIDTLVQALKEDAKTPAFKPPLMKRILNGLEGGSKRHPQVFPEIPGYEVTEFIGMGGMGAVYKARHLRLQRYDAIKVLNDSAAKVTALSDRFDREMAAVGRLNHMHLVRGYDAAEFRGQRYLVMEYLEGADVSEILAHSRCLKVPDACKIIQQAALGLQSAHDQGMVHRDIKPSNLFLTQTGSETPIVKVLDMGLAMFSDQHTPSDGLTSTGQIMGTLEYMAPEQGGSEGTVDHRADIYSLGCSLYKMLCSETPFNAREFDSPIKLLTALATKTPTPIEQRCDIPPKLATLIGSMISRDPNARPASAAEVATALEPFLQGNDLKSALQVNRFDDQSFAIEDTLNLLPTTAPDGPKTLKQDSVSSKPILRNRWLLAATILLMLAILLAPIVMHLQTPDGTVRIEVNDPALEVVAKGGDITISGNDTKTISLSPGKHAITVKRDGFEFETVGFEVKDRKETVVKVDWIEGVLEVVNEDKVLHPKVIRGPGDAPELTPESEFALNRKPEPPLVLNGELAKTPTWEPGSSETLISRGLIPTPAVFPGVKRWQLYVNRAVDGRESKQQVSPNGKFLAQVTKSNHRERNWPGPQLRVYALETGELIYLSPVKGTAYSPVWSKDSRSLAIDGEEFKRNLDGSRGDPIIEPVRGEAWELMTPELYDQLRLPPSPMKYNSITDWDPSGAYFATALATGVHVFAADGVRRQILQGADKVEQGRRLSWSADGQHISFAGMGRLIIWNVKSAEIVLDIEGKHTPDAQFHPTNSELMAIGDKTPKIIRWQEPGAFDAIGGEGVGRDQVSWTLKWSSDGKYFAGNSGEALSVWNSKGEQVCTKDGLTVPQTAFFFAPDNQRVMCCQTWGYYSLTLAGKLIEVTPKMKGTDYLEANHDGSMFSQQATLFRGDDAELGPELEPAWDDDFPYAGYAVPSFSNDGKHLAITCRLGTIIRNTTDYKIECMIISLPNDQYVTLSPAGEILSASEQAGDELFYLVVDDNDQLNLYRPSEFTKKVVEK